MKYTQHEGKTLSFSSHEKLGTTQTKMINICLNPPPPPLYSKTSSSSLFFFFSNFLGYSQPHHHHYQPQDRKQKRVVDKRGGRFNIRGRKRILINCGFLPVDPWAPTTNIDSQSIASQLFAASLFPYLGFLYFITKSKSAPKLTLFGFYFLLAFVGATIPAGIYAKVNYGTNLANVDWLHGGAESLLTLTNLFIVMGLRGALRKEQDKNDESTNEVVSTIIKDNKKSQ